MIDIYERLGIQDGVERLVIQLHGAEQYEAMAEQVDWPLLRAQINQLYHDTLTDEELDSIALAADNSFITACRAYLRSKHPTLESSLLGIMMKAIKEEV